MFSTAVATKFSFCLYVEVRFDEVRFDRAKTVLTFTTEGTVGVLLTFNFMSQDGLHVVGNTQNI